MVEMQTLTDSGTGVYDASGSDDQWLDVVFGGILDPSGFKTLDWKNFIWWDEKKSCVY